MVSPASVAGIRRDSSGSQWKIGLCRFVALTGEFTRAGASAYGCSSVLLLVRLIGRNRGKHLRIDVAVALRCALDRVGSESETVEFWLFVFHTLTSFPLILDSSLLHSNTRP